MVRFIPVFAQGVVGAGFSLIVASWMAAVRIGLDGSLLTSSPA